MNKRALRIAGWALGLSLAVAGIGVIAGASFSAHYNDPLMVKAEETTATWTASAGALGTGVGSGTFTDNKSNTWSYTRTLESGESYTGWTSNCIQLGSKNGVENLTLTTSAITGTIKSVSVECSSYNNAHTVAIEVGGTSYLSATATAKWTTVSAKTGTGTSSGKITISFAGGTRALYIKSITVVSEPITGYKVTYNGNGNTGGSVPTDATNYNLDGSGTCTVLGNVNSLAKTHFAFNGWNTEANGSGTGYKAGDTFIVGNDVTLYAQWVTSEVWLSTTSGEVNKGGTLDISSFVNGATGEVTYSSSDETKATVSNAGVITGVTTATGIAITVSDDGTDTNATFLVDIVEYDNTFNIVDGGAYKIHHTKKDTTKVYYPQGRGEDGTPLATLNAWESTVFNFKQVGDDEFYIMAGSKYLYTSDSNNGLRIGSTEQSWKLLESTTTKTGDYEVQNQTYNTRYLSLYGTADFRTYSGASATNRTENTDLTVYSDAEFAGDVLDATDTVCAGGYDNVKSDFADIWTILSADYSALLSVDKSDFAGALAKADGTALQKAAARYDYLVGKYKLDDFADRKPVAIGGVASVSFVHRENKSNLPLVVTVAALGTGAAVGFFLFQRKRKLI